MDEVVDYFGYWPLFCDAPILNFSYEDDTIELLLSYIDSEKALGAKVALTFSGVSEFSLSQYVSGSILDALKIESGNVVSVFIEPCYGMGGSFKCTSVIARITNA